MSWITISIELNDNQAQIRVIDINRLLIREGHNYIYWSQLDIEII